MRRRSLAFGLTALLAASVAACVIPLGSLSQPVDAGEPVGSILDGNGIDGCDNSGHSAGDDASGGDGSPIDASASDSSSADAAGLDAG